MRRRSTYSQWFKEATGFEPYRYQGELAERTLPPSVLQVPTGSGKTQGILGAWLYQRLVRDSGPRRLVYALPMRSLVEQTREVAAKMRAELGKTAEELPIHVLMGGEDLLKDDWRLKPDADQIMIGTIDLLLSRALNRGYGESRFAWPVSFGLLNSDCRWVFDEVQLMGPARATSAQLDGLRAVFGTVLPCETTWVSATVNREALKTIDRPEIGELMGLPAADRKGRLEKRLTATKALERVDLGEQDPKTRLAAIAEQVLARHASGTRTIVVLNRVETAQGVFGALEELTGGDGPETILLHSRFLPRDRREHMERALAEPADTGTILVATQVIEAGVDVSSRTLITETAPFSSIVQRLGRCNREGDEPSARVIWLDNGPIEESPAGLGEASPYSPTDLNRAREELERLDGSSLSPETLEKIEVDETQNDLAMLRRCDLIDLFDTSPDLSGLDIDIAPFIREDDERSVLVCFRKIGDDNRPTYEGMPCNEEVVQIPRDSLRDRRCWKADHVNRSWEPMNGRAVPPGATIVLDAVEGGYTHELGWKGSSKLEVEVVDPPERHGSPETCEDDDQGASPQELLDHLSEAHQQAIGLLGETGLSQWSDAIASAAALHDIGKAHWSFQRTLRTAMGMDPDADDGKLWAKSGAEGGERRRRYLRHELAGALALRGLDGAIELPQPDLVTYLVAAHHGRVRLSIRPAPGELQDEAGDDRRFALGIVEGDELPAVDTPIGHVPPTVLSLACMELGAENAWTHAAAALRDAPELGPFRLAFLEAVVRVADWRASA